MTEAVVAVCPNPRCRMVIEEPILLTILSFTPPKQYKACPHCFAKLEQEPPVEQKIVPESTTVDHEEVMTDEEDTSPLSVNLVLEKVKDSGPRLLKKVKALIPNSNEFEKEEREKIEEPQAELFDKEETVTEEPQIEAFVNEEESEEELQIEPPVTEAAKQEPKTEQSAKKESGFSGCPQTFGYLANRPIGAPIPSDCLLCLKMVDCMLKTDVD